MQWSWKRLVIRNVYTWVWNTNCSTIIMWPSWPRGGIRAIKLIVRCIHQLVVSIALYHGMQAFFRWRTPFENYRRKQVTSSWTSWQERHVDRFWSENGSIFSQCKGTILVLQLESKGISSVFYRLAVSTMHVGGYLVTKLQLNCYAGHCNFSMCYT